MVGLVTVAYKGELGLTLRLFEMKERVFYDKSGRGFSAPEAVDMNQRVTIKGTSVPPGHHSDTANGYALTHNVDADFWEAWVAQNAKSPLVTNGAIFAHGKLVDVKAEAREKKNIRSGAERLLQVDDPRTKQRPVRAE